VIVAVPVPGFTRRKTSDFIMLFPSTALPADVSDCAPNVTLETAVPPPRMDRPTRRSRLLPEPTVWLHERVV
jgi:hypothetical protein